MILLISTFLVLQTQAQAQARAEIKIAEQVEVSQHEQIKLSELVELSNARPSVLLELDKNEIAYKENMNSEELIQIFKNLPIEASYKIPQNVHLKKSAQKISKEEVTRALNNHFQAQCPQCDFKISIHGLPQMSGTHWNIDYNQATPKGSFLLPVYEEGLTNSKWLSGQVRVFKSVPVANKMINLGERVHEEDLKLEKTDVTFAKDGDIAIKDIVGQSLKKPLQLGQPIWASDIKKEEAARRGQLVKAVMGDENFEISVNVEAQESGFVGDQIKVKNLDTQKMLSALITDKGVVKIQ